MLAPCVARVALARPATGSKSSALYAVPSPSLLYSPGHAGSVAAFSLLYISTRLGYQIARFYASFGCCTEYMRSSVTELMLVELNPVRGRLGLPLRPTYRRITTTSTFPAAGLVKKDTSLRAERGRAAKLRAATTRVRPQDSPESQSYAASHISATPAAAPRARSAGTLDSPSFRRAPQRDATPRAERAPPNARRSARRQRARAATHRERHR